MTVDEKLLLIEKVLKTPPYTLNMDTQLSTISSWDSLNMLNIQIELEVIGFEIPIFKLSTCKTVEELCDLF